METRNRGTKSTFISSLSGSYNDEINDNLRRSKYRNEDEPFFYSERSPFIVLILLLCIFGWVRYVGYRLPVMITQSEMSKYPNGFIGERAWKDLELMTSYGQRVSGSYENNVKTVNLLVEALTKIQQDKLAVYNVEFEVKYPSGAFALEFLHDVFTNSYHHIPIVVAKLEPINKYLHSNDSILLNCHFDSFLSSPDTSNVCFNEALKI